MSMASLVKSVMLKIVADDGDAEAKLDRISAKADELGREHPEIKVRIDAAAASAKMAVLREELKQTAKAGDSGGRSGIFGKLLFGAASGIESFGNMGTAFINPITIALAGLAAILAGPLIAALLPVTAGFGVFGAVAFGEVSKLSAAFNSLNTAQAQLAAAKTPTQRAAALHAEQVAMAGLNTQERTLVPLTQQLGGMVTKLMKAVQPEIITAFGTGMRIIKDMMPALTTLAVAAGKAFDGFLKNIQNWIEGPSGKKFLHWMAVDGPRDIAIFGRIMWDVAQGIGRTFDFLKNAGDSWYRNVTNGIHTIIHWFDEAKSFVQSALGFVKASLSRNATDFNNWVNDVVQFGGRVISWFEQLPGRIVSALAGLAGQLFAIGVHVIQGLVNGIESMAGSVLSAVGHIASSIPGKIASFLGIGSPSRVMYQHGLWIAQGLSMGMDAGAPGVAASAARMAHTALPGFGAGGGGGVTYNIRVEVPATTSPAAVGRQIVEYIREYERGSGKRWRTAT